MSDLVQHEAAIKREAAKRLAKKRHGATDPQVKGMAARDLSPEAQRRRAETARLRIQTSSIIDRVQKHAMGKLAMTPTQLTAAQTLLRKTLPDLVGVKVDAEVSPVIFNFNIGAPTVVNLPAERVITKE